MFRAANMADSDASRGPVRHRRHGSQCGKRRLDVVHGDDGKFIHGSVSERTPLISVCVAERANMRQWPKAKAGLWKSNVLREAQQQHSDIFRRSPIRRQEGRCEHGCDFYLVDAAKYSLRTTMIGQIAGRLNCAMCRGDPHHSRRRSSFRCTVSRQAVVVFSRRLHATSFLYGVLLQTFTPVIPSDTMAVFFFSRQCFLLPTQRIALHAGTPAHGGHFVANSP